MRPLRLILFLLALVTANAINAQVTVSGTVGGSSTYSNLQGAINAINSGTHGGAITVLVTASNSYGSSASLVASGSGGANYTSILITVNSGHFIISNSGFFDNPLLILNGADNVTIDGKNTSAASLTFNNTTGSNGTVLNFTNGASNNTIKNCKLYSNHTSTSAEWGVITFSSTANNNNNTITGCDIGGSTGTAKHAISGVGNASTSTFSNNITISNNNIFNFFSATRHSFGVYALDGHTGWTITGNRFFQTSSRTSTASGYYHGAIWIYSPTYNSDFTIRGNTIGFASSAQTGNYNLISNGDCPFWGITLYISSSNTNSSIIDSNVIRSIIFTSKGQNTGLNGYGPGIFSGIWAASGKINVGTTYGNFIGYTASTSIAIFNENVSSTAPGTTINGIHYRASGTLINNNKVGNINVVCSAATAKVRLNGIQAYPSTPGVQITNNWIENGPGSTFSLTLSHSSGFSSAGHDVNGIWCMNNGNITSNNVKYINVIDTGATKLCGIFSQGGVNASITGNTIEVLQTNSKSNTSAQIDIALSGINIGAGGSGSGIIQQNTIFGLTNSYTGSGTTTVTGINDSSLATYVYDANKIYNLYNSSQSNNALITGISLHTDRSRVLQNNMISINSTVKNLYGIENYHTGALNAYYNSIYLAGTNASLVLSSCIKTTASSSGTQNKFLNNIFYQNRSGGGNHSAILTTGLPTSTTAVFNYNLYVVPSLSAIARSSSVNYNWSSTYASTFAGDKYSWAVPTSTIDPSLFFLNATTGDLHLNESNNLVWYVNGKGWPVAGLDYDFDLSNGDRSASLSDGATDIGADEVVPTVAPPAATHTGTFAAGQSSVYVFGGRTIAQIDWQTGSTLPTAQPTVLYYSGNNPPYPIPGKNAANCYWKIDATATADLNYKLKLWMSPAVMGAVPSTLDLRMAKNSSNAPSGWSCACSSTNMDANTYSFNNSASYTSFSFFTATDNNNPLPVALLSFTATPYQDKAQLTWATASEQNSAYFDIERSTDGNIFSKKGTLAAAGNSISTQEYAFEDATPITTPITYYRLKMVDADGSFSYSEIRKVERTLANGAIAVYPSPTSGTFYITIPEGQEIPAHLELTDITGKVWLMQEITLNAHIPVKLEFPSKASSGLYFLSVLCNGKTSLVKLSLSH